MYARLLPYRWHCCACIARCDAPDTAVSLRCCSKASDVCACNPGLVKTGHCDSCVMGSTRVRASRQTTLHEFECRACGVQKVVCSLWLDFVLEPRLILSFSTRNGWNSRSVPCWRFGLSFVCVQVLKSCQWLKNLVLCVSLCFLVAWLGGGVASHANTSPLSISCHGRLEVHLIRASPFLILVFIGLF